MQREQARPRLAVPSGNYPAEARDAAEHPEIHSQQRTTQSKRHPAEAEKPWSRYK